MLPILPPLPEAGEPTRTTLQAYARAAVAVPRALAIAHPLWWHVSLQVGPAGLTSDLVDLPGGGTMDLVLDLAGHVLRLRRSSGPGEEIPLTDGRSGTEMADAIIDAAARWGLEGSYERSKFEDDAAGEYDPEAARAYHDALLGAAGLLERHRRELDPLRTGPVQLWPHHFDLSFEYFGTRRIEYDEPGGPRPYPAQLNLGFVPEHPAYFYSNPWPFPGDSLLGVDLPGAGRWITEPFEGSILSYADVAGTTEGAHDVLAYARAVYEAAAPGLDEVTPPAPG